MRIAFVGQEEYFKIHYEDDLDHRHDVFRMDFHYHMQPSDFGRLKAFNPDYSFFFRGEFMPDGVVREIPGVKIAISSEPFPKVFDRRLHTNESFVERLETFLAIADKKFDYVFHYDDLSLPVLERVGARISGAWPFPIATRKVANFDPSTALIPSINGQLDFFFAGRSTKHREKFFGHLKHLHNFLHIESGVPGLNALPLARASKIVLNVHADEGISWEPRVQFFMAAGCFVMSERISPNKYIQPGKHFVEFSSPEELHRSVERYLENDEEREQIARAGQERVQDMLSANNQYDKLIADITQNKYPRPVFKPMKAAIASLKFNALHPETDFVRNRFLQFSDLID